MSRVAQPPPNLVISQNNTFSPSANRPRTEYDFNPEFQHPITTKEKILQKFNLQPRNVRQRKTITPPEISMDATLLLLHECCDGLTVLEQEITGIEKLKREMNELTVFLNNTGYFRIKAV
jgi:hypothetical protein